MLSMPIFSSLISILDRALAIKTYPNFYPPFLGIKSFKTAFKEDNLESFENYQVREVGKEAWIALNKPVTTL